MSDHCTCGLAQIGMAYNPMDRCPEHVNAEGFKRLLAQLDALTAKLAAAEAKLAKATAVVEQLSAQVREFRQKCDPREEHVLVTPAELANYHAAGPGLAEKLGASHVEQHESHAAAVRAGVKRVTWGSVAAARRADQERSTGPAETETAGEP